MRQYSSGDPIRVRLDDGSQPRVFVWHGRAHRIETIEDVREPRMEWWTATGEIHRLYYFVTTHRAMICEIYQDRTTESWYLSRVFD